MSDVREIRSTGEKTKGEDSERSRAGEMKVTLAALVGRQRGKGSIGFEAAEEVAQRSK
jgi:hypothetical protein